MSSNTKHSTSVHSASTGAIYYRIWLDEFSPQGAGADFAAAHIHPQAKAASLAIRKGRVDAPDELAGIMRAADPNRFLDLPSGTYRRRAVIALGLEQPTPLP